MRLSLYEKGKNVSLSVSQYEKSCFITIHFYKRNHPKKKRQSTHFLFVSKLNIKVVIPSLKFSLGDSRVVTDSL